jgi:hypothetical protein
MTLSEIYISVWFMSLIFFTITTGLSMYETEGVLATTIFTSMMSVVFVISLFATVFLIT